MGHERRLRVNLVLIAALTALAQNGPGPRRSTATASRPLLGAGLAGAGIAGCISPPRRRSTRSRSASPAAASRARRRPSTAQ